MLKILSKSDARKNILMKYVFRGHWKSIERLENISNALIIQFKQKILLAHVRQEEKFQTSFLMNLNGNFMSVWLF